MSAPVADAVHEDDDLLQLLPQVAATGPFAWFDYGGSRRLLVDDPAEIHRLLARGDDGMRVTPVTTAVRRVMGDGLLTTRAPRWRPRRLVVQRELSHSAVRSFAGVIEANTRALLEGWSRGDRIDLKAELSRLALDNLGDAVFGSDFRAYRETVGRAVDSTLAVLEEANRGRPESDSSRRLDAAVADLDAFVGALVADGGRDRAGILDVLVRAATSGAPEFADPWVRDEAVTLIMAGHDTVAFATTMATHLLAGSPEVLARLRDQVGAALDRGVGVADLAAEAPLAARVVEETLRLYPPVPVLHRTAPEGCTVGPEQVPAGTILVLSPWVTQRDERYFPDPLAFDPERFSPGRRAGIPRHAYFPFGAGPRVCAGNHFALLECVVVVALLALHADLRMVQPGTPAVVAPVGLRFVDPVPAVVEELR